jgi:alkaline phosphatase D
MRFLTASLICLLPSLALAEDDPLHAGPMLGYTALRSATVWVQTTRPVEVQLRYHPAENAEAARLTAPTRTAAEADHALTVLLDGLEPGTTYHYEVYLDGERVQRDYPFRVTTRTLWQWRTAPPEVRVLLGSCAFINETPYDRPGRPYGGGYEIFDVMAAEGADAMVWTGDNVYLREVDYYTVEGILARYRHVRGLPELRRLFAAQPHYAIWDDHDYGPDNSDRTYALKGPSLEVFKRYWPAVQYGAPGVPGVFQRVQLADAELFLLDNRYHRSPNDMPGVKTFLGAAQLQWLREALVSSEARFKLIVVGNPILTQRSPYESISRLFPEELEQILGWIREQKVEGVVFFTGDRHHTELVRREQDGCYPLYDYTNSPLTSGTYPMKDGHPELDNPDRVEGTLLQERNYGLFELKGPKADRRIVLIAKTADGTEAWRHEIRHAELTFPKAEGGGD